VSALILDGVFKSRGRGLRATPVLRNVSLAVESGEVVVVEGPSGSGKTTLLSVAGGLLSPDGGEVRLDGQSMRALSFAARRRLRARSVGVVFQRSNLLPGLTVRENVRLMAGLAGVSTAEARGETEALLEALRVAHVGDRYPRELSGGEEQRVAVARALVHRPRLVLADEPTGSLDRASGAAVADQMAELARSRGAAVLLATHDPRLRAYATRRFVLRDGTLESAEVSASEEAL
jgi:ABC-type lipoprotein export system ATPase subunit